MKLIDRIVFLKNHPNPYIKILGAIKIRINKIRGRLWCLLNLVDVEKFFKDTGIIEQEDFYKKFEKELVGAQKIIDNCPVKMGGPGNLEIIYNLTKHLKAKKIIETGVAYGWSSLIFLLAIKENGGGKLISTDMPYSKETANYVGCVVPEDLRRYWTLIKESDETGLIKALEILPEVDICHYDSDKTYKGRMFAYPKMWEAIRPGGVFISDDIGDNLAFRDFSKKIKINPIVIKKGKNFVGILFKK